MRTAPRIALLTCLVVAPLMAACSADEPTPSASGTTSNGARTALGRTVESALREAREEMATENIGIGSDMDIDIGGTRINQSAPRDADGNHLPKAEISPEGDLLIAGKAVEVTAAQRALLLDYRGHVVDMVETGMAIGVKGADLGMQAAGEALKNVFTGGAEDFEQRIEAEVALIEAEALKLCDALPALLDTQSQLAASLPEFRPYATMEVKDVDECRDGVDHQAQQAEVRDDIRGSIRDAVQTAVQQSGVADASTTDTSDTTNTEPTAAAATP